MREYWSRFIVLHPLVQAVLLIGIFALTVAITFNHTVEENFVNLLFAIQTMIVASKMPQKKSEEK